MSWTATQVAGPGKPRYRFSEEVRYFREEWIPEVGRFASRILAAIRGFI